MQKLCARLLMPLAVQAVAALALAQGGAGELKQQGSVPQMTDGSKPDQVGMIELIRLRCRQPFARYIEKEIAQEFGGRAVGQALEAGDEAIPGQPRRPGRPQRLDFERAGAVFRFKRAVTGDSRRLRRERPQPDLAAGPVRRADAGDADAHFV